MNLAILIGYQTYELLKSFSKLCKSLSNTHKTCKWFEIWLAAELSIFVTFLITFRAMEEHNNTNKSEKERFLLKHHFQSLLISLL